ncbi:hypothetical protein SUGI_0062190 [Cryptomeria japonica]|nr:hypothetical protein SUGI_0062190 [Cryptomeria japonica]
MENNSAEMCESSGSLMEDDVFMIGTHIIGGLDSSAMLGSFPDFHRGDLVITDRLWTGNDFTDGQQLTEQYHIEEAYHQVMGIQQISGSPPQYELLGNNIDPNCRSKLSSAFRDYRKEPTKEVQLCLAPAVKQKSLKRCFDFLRRTYKNSRDKSSWKANDELVEESYAFTHKLAERNRRTKLSQQFLALRSLVPHSPKKVDKISTLTNAISQLNQQKLRIEELEQQNQSLTSALRENSMSEACSSLSYGCAADSTRDALMQCICEEADVLVEKTSIPDEVIIEVTLKRIASNCTHMDAIATVDKCLREMELKVVRIQWRELGSANQLIEGTIRRETKGERWEMRQIKTAVKRALTGN